MLNRVQKEEQVALLKESFSRATGVFVADYRGLTVDNVNVLRSKLKTEDFGGEVEYRVTKNSLLLRATADTPLSVLQDHFVGPTAVAISYGDPAAVAKALVNYADEHEVFELKGAFLDGKALDQSEIATLATLPTLHELRGKLAGLLQAPASKLARLMKEPGGQLARLLDARRESLEEGG